MCRGMGMNYIWDLLIKAKKAGFQKKDIEFFLPNTYSPYMELSNEYLNGTAIVQRMGVNPYYRFYEIFKDLFSLDNHEEEALRQVLLDLVLHFLAEIDFVQGMNKREYYIQFVLKDMEDGIFGRVVKENIGLFSKEEQEEISLHVLRLYKSGEAVYLLKETLRKIFKDCSVYAKCDEKDELLIYIGKQRNRETQAKIDLLLQLFLPVRFQTVIYWEKHFGIIDIDETMKVEHIALY